MIRQIETRYNSAKTLAVDFRQEYAILGHPRPSEAGTLTLRKIGKMRWDYVRPAGKVFISDGKTLYLYTAADNRVEKVPLKNTEDMRAPLAFLLGRLNFRKDFRDVSVAADGSGFRVTAEAQTNQLPYQSVEMSISPDGQIHQLVVRGRDQSVSSYSFENERLNPPVREALFHFTVPAGAEVVDAVETRTVEGR